MEGLATPILVSFRGLIQNFRPASPPISYGSLPGPERLQQVTMCSLRPGPLIGLYTHVLSRGNSPRAVD